MDSRICFSALEREIRRYWVPEILIQTRWFTILASLYDPAYEKCYVR
jgi:hypothetical protein